MTGTLESTGTISGTLSAVGTISGTLASTESITGELTIPTYYDVDLYSGEYTFTPSNETQTISTENKTLTQNITINPIPSNYGLITWNGSTLTVS